MAPTHRYFDHHKRALLDPQGWHKAGMDLIESAKFLHPCVQQYWNDKASRKDTERHLSTFMMLCGFAIENLLKALIVLIRHDSIEKEIDSAPIFPDMLATHQLSILVKDAGLEAEMNVHIDLLERLTRAAIWRGRYPCPIRAEQWEMPDPFGMAGRGWVPMNSYNSKDPDDVMGIVNTIVAKMNAQPSPSPSGKK